MEVIPPVVDTAMTAGRNEEKVAPEVVAEKILEALGSSREELWIGKARLLYWIHRIVPTLAERLMARE